MIKRQQNRNKYYIYRCKLNKVHPILRVYKAKIKAVYQVEKKIASRRNKLTKHIKKWGKAFGICICRLVVWVFSMCPSYDFLLIIFDNNDDDDNY